MARVRLPHSLDSRVRMVQKRERPQRSHGDCATGARNKPDVRAIKAFGFFICRSIA